MWSLNGNDIEQAKEQLNGRRAAIKARYDEEMKRVDDQLAEIDKFERAAREFMSQFKLGEAAGAADPELAPEPTPIPEPVGESFEPIAAPGAVQEHSEPRPILPVETAAETGGEPAGASRWRLRLNSGSVTEAA
jgi:hypothetical protein